MPVYRVPVGSLRTTDGVEFDYTQTVEFEGDELAVREKTIDPDGTRGFKETLYYTADRRLLVHVANWYQQRGEMVSYALLEITRVDLQPGGRFEELALGAWAWLRK
ncbi:MAG: hypothetical protein GX601_01840 [Anaerolineales bacterium]|nr:hypothetical protein [Anaerolineales bacterium]